MKNLIPAVVLMSLGHLTLAAPATLVQSATYDSETIPMRLTKENLRGSEFELWSKNASGGYTMTVYDPSASTQRYYRVRIELPQEQTLACKTYRSQFV